MSLHNDQILSQVNRYGQNMREASFAEHGRYATAYGEFAAQFDDVTRQRMNQVLAVSLTGGLYEDRRIRGKR
jgi:hypothetical protein